ncbi:protein-L-isoaspartate O-methyltransferase [Candidatus Pacearchaeota archaeon]|nr:protein-L-isoaspartate O-methyltransferase [Candidatus Pacearchaeota archaeon]
MKKQALLASLKKQRFNKKIIEAFNKVKRENFISEEFKEYTYEDITLSIGFGQTISQPFTIAFMLNLLELDKLTKNNKLKILEIGSGSGYVLALISELVNKNSEIYGIERVKEIAEKSQDVLKEHKNIVVIHRNGFNGLKEKAPFDRILISAACPRIPRQLFEQLNENGILVASVKNSVFQFKKQKNTIITKEFPGFVFVPLVEE